MANETAPCLTPRCRRRSPRRALLCDVCFRRQDRRELANYGELTRLVDDELVPVELERIHQAAWRAAKRKRAQAPAPRTAN